VPLNVVGATSAVAGEKPLASKRRSPANARFISISLLRVPQ
jgi:hypothetical protein